MNMQAGMAVKFNVSGWHSAARRIAMAHLSFKESSFPADNDGKAHIRRFNGPGRISW
jgi:hypothetical protein